MTKITSAKVVVCSCLHEAPKDLGALRHEQVAIFEENQRIANVCRIATVSQKRSNSVILRKNKETQYEDRSDHGEFPGSQERCH